MPRLRTAPVGLATPRANAHPAEARPAATIPLAAPPAVERPALQPVPRLVLQLRLPAPAWQLALADALAPELGRPALQAAAPTVALALCAEGAARLTGPGPHWLLVDGQGRLLHPQRPLWAALGRGEGLALQLWQRAHAQAPWRCLRQAHAGADPRPSRAAPQLAGLAARLVRQALVDCSLGQTPCTTSRPAVPEAPEMPNAPAAPLAQPPQAPADAQALRSAVRGWLRAARTRLRAQFTTEAWRIGVVHAPVAQWLASGGRLPVQWLAPAGPSRYDADPMGVPGNPQVLLCETFDERVGLGWIDRLTLGPDQQVATRERLPLDEGRHVSFPMMVVLDGERYGILESAARGDCVLHRVDDEGRWHRLATMVHDQPLADPALFRHQGRWWLAATDLRIGSQDNLCLYHAPRPEGPWRAHANNPVKLDIGSARMAGPVFRLPASALPGGDAAPHAAIDADGSVLVRPGQDCLGGYGRALVFHRITELTPTRFAEERITRIAPDALAAAGSPGLDGVHTACPWGQRTLVDAKRHVVDPQALLRKLRERLGRRRRG